MRGRSSTTRMCTGTWYLTRFSRHHSMSSSGSGWGGKLNGGDRHLPEPLVRDADDRRLRHRRMPLESSLDHLRHDCEATAIDGVIGPAEDPDEAVLVHPGVVGGADPAILGPNGRLRRVHRDEPFAAPRQFGAGLRVHDPDLDPRAGAACRAPLGFVELLVVRKRPADQAPGKLGRAVGGEHRDPVLGGERVVKLGRERSGAAADRPEADDLPQRDVRVEHHAQGGRRQASGPGTVLLDEVGPGGRRRTGRAGSPPAPRPAPGRPPRIPQREQARASRSLPRSAPAGGWRGSVTWPAVFRDPLQGAVEVRVAVGDPLRRPGGAAGGHQNGDPGIGLALHRGGG